jgi:hypothetical protein
MTPASAPERRIRWLPRGAVVDIGPGCHTGAFFAQQEPPSLELLGRHLGGWLPAP